MLCGREGYLSVVAPVPATCPAPVTRAVQCAALAALAAVLRVSTDPAETHTPPRLEGVVWAAGDHAAASGLISSASLYGIIGHGSTTKYKDFPLAKQANTLRGGMVACIKL